MKNQTYREVASWPNADVTTKVGQKRLMEICESDRPFVQQIFDEISRKRSDRNYRKWKRLTLGFTSRAVGEIVVVSQQLVPDYHRELSRVCDYKAAKKQAWKNSLAAKGVIFNLMGEVALQNLAARNNISVEEKTAWNGYGYKVVARNIATNDESRWAEVLLAYHAVEKAKKEKRLARPTDIAQAREFGVPIAKLRKAIARHGQVVLERLRGIRAAAKNAAYERRQAERVKTWTKTVEEVLADKDYGYDVETGVDLVLEKIESGEGVGAAWNNGDFNDGRHAFVRCVLGAAHRHEHTTYDSLLREGYDRDDAFAMREDY